MKKILAVTGIRSEYDILFPVIDYLRHDPAFDVSLAVCSAHLSEWHGQTLAQIEADGFRIADRIDSLFMTDRLTQRPKGTGMLIYSLSQTVEREKPDFLLVVGDREESIATAVVGNYMKVLTVHIGGGDPVFGNADDPIRMAVTKLSHIHFATARQYADNLLRLSEDPFRVVFSGNPALTNIKNTPQKSLTELSRYIDFDITDGKYIVLIKHPLSSEQEDAYNQMKVTLEALEVFCDRYQYKVVASYPNTDPGSYGILDAVGEFSKKKFIRFNKTLPRDFFVNLMRNATALAGNSSMGILEAPFYRLPVVNIGNRQQGRLNAGNVKFVKHEAPEIVAALEQACLDETYRKHVGSLENPYGNGDAPEIIGDTLRKIDPKDPSWLTKTKLC